MRQAVPVAAHPPYPLRLLPFDDMDDLRGNVHAVALPARGLVEHALFHQLVDVQLRRPRGDPHALAD